MRKAVGSMLFTLGVAWATTIAVGTIILVLTWQPITVTTSNSSYQRTLTLSPLAGVLAAAIALLLILPGMYLNRGILKNRRKHFAAALLIAIALLGIWII